MQLLNKSEKINRFIFITISVLFFMVSLIPFNFLALKIFGLPFHYIFIGGTVCLLVILSWLTDKKLTLFDKWLFIIMFGFSLSLISSIDRTYTIRTLGSFFLRGISVAFIAERVFRNREKTTVFILLVCASLVSLIGLIEFVFHWNPFFRLAPALVNFSLSSRSGMSSTIGHPLALSAYLVLFLPLSVLFTQTKGKKTFLKFIPLLLILATILLSFSRSSWISCLFALLIYFLSRENLNKLIKNWKIIPAFMIVIVSIFLLSSRIRTVFYERANFQRLKSEIFSSHRSASYKTTWNIFKKYPFFGVGFGNYPKVHEVYRAEGTSPFFKTPDNIYLRFLCETGIIGIVTFLIFMFYWLTKLWQNRNNLFIFAIFAGLAGFLINQMAADLFYWLAPQFAFWILFGISMGNLQKHEFKKSF